MTEKQIRSMLQELAEQKAPASEIDLWDGVAARLEQAPLQTSDRTQNRGFKMNTNRNHNRLLNYAALAILAIILVGGLFFATPRGRALADEFLRFFTRSSSDTIPAPTEVPLNWVEQTPGVPAPTNTPIPSAAFEAECGPTNSPKCSTEQIRSLVNFTVKELNAIPEKMVFIGATGGADEVFISYDTPDHSGGIALFERPWNDAAEQSNWKVGASAVVEKVKIGSNDGEYVKGSFGYMAGETEEQWNANADVQTLRWVDQGVSIILQNYGTQLDRDALFKLAAGLTTEPVSATITPAPTATESASESFDIRTVYPLTVEEAEGKAGFKLLQPVKLPDILSLIGASFEPEYKSVSLFYLRSQDVGPNTDGLVLTEELIPSTKTNDQCGFTIGDKEDLEASTSGEVSHLCGIKIVGNFEEVKIGDIPGQYTEGVWSASDQGWAWNADPYLKTLRWQKDGLALELMYMGMDITKEDMIAIAMNLK